MTPEEFNQLTETGRFRAFREQELRAEAAEAKNEQIFRNLFGAILTLKSRDELMAQLIRMAERMGERIDLVIK